MDWFDLLAVQGTLKSLLVFWPGEFYGLYSPWGLKELDTNEQLSFH